MNDIPNDILKAISTAARAEWPDDVDMQEYVIDSEAAAYREIQQTDFGPALLYKERILNGAVECEPTWEDRALFVNHEIEAFVALQSLSADDVPSNVLLEARLKSEVDSDWFSTQLEDIQLSLQQYRDVRDIRIKIDPIRKMLNRMERIIGNSCYNGNIQNYADIEGRSFRYPISFPTLDGSIEKRWDQQDDLPPEVLINGYYKLGANEMNIYGALVRIIDVLETDYGFVRPCG